MDIQGAFQLKASFSPCTVFEIQRYDLTLLEQQLAAAQQRAPQFFSGIPVIIDFEKVQTISHLNFGGLKSILVQYGLVPVGAWNIPIERQADALLHGIPPIQRTKSSLSELQKKLIPDEFETTQIVTQPVRSGMRVYAKEADLVVMSTVSPGAEILADGHIHLYGTLRGRALAGVQGNHQARIFCKTLDAELISIAGYYLTKEEMQTLKIPDTMMQIFLDQQQIRIEAIV